MVKWIITNIEKKSVCEINKWTKNNEIIRLIEFYRFGEWMCLSEIKPEIDLINDEVYEVTNSKYEWEMLVMSDGQGFEWHFPDKMDNAEKEAIEEAWSEKTYEGLAELGWEEQPVTQWIYGPISLEEDTGNE